jgi:hypothetical protein
VATWLARIGVAVKEFLSFAEGLTKRFCQQTDRLAEAWGRKVRYLPGVVDKEDLVAEIRQKEGVAENGVVAVLSTLEMGMSQEVSSGKWRVQVGKTVPPATCHWHWPLLPIGTTAVLG